MAIQRYDPFREVVSLRDAVNSLLQDSVVRPIGAGIPGDDAVMLPLDIAETENEFVVKAALPGARPEDVQITAHGNTLTIRGEIRSDEEKQGEQYHLRERRFGQFQRTVTLPTSISADKAQAHFEDGVLTLTLPKSEEAKPKQIKVVPSTTRETVAAGARGKGSA